MIWFWMFGYPLAAVIQVIATFAICNETIYFIKYAIADHKKNESYADRINKKNIIDRKENDDIV